MEYINLIVNGAVSLMTKYGIIFGFLLIISESIIPILPLSVFIALNVASYGYIVAIITSWIATVLGSTLSFFAFRKLFQKKLYKFIKKKKYESVENMMDLISNIKLPNLVIIIAIPFSPAFLVNIGAGLSKIKYKKFLAALIIGKFIMVYFWAYIGKSFLESIGDISTIIRITILLFIAFVISKMVEKKFNIK